MAVDYGKYICSRARVEGIRKEGKKWIARVCSWFGSETACVDYDITTSIEQLLKEEVEEILREKCYDDEECIEENYDIALEEAEERLLEGDLVEKLAEVYVDVQHACEDLIDALAPRNKRKTLLDYL